MGRLIRGWSVLGQTIVPIPGAGAYPHMHVHTREARAGAQASVLIIISHVGICRKLSKRINMQQHVHTRARAVWHTHEKTARKTANMRFQTTSTSHPSQNCRKKSSKNSAATTLRSLMDRAGIMTHFAIAAEVQHT